MPDGMTRHYQSSPLPDLGGLLFPLANAIPHQVSTALFLLMHCNSHGRMTARGLSRRAQSGEQCWARGRHSMGLFDGSCTLAPRRQTRTRQRASARLAIRAGTHRGPTSGLAPGYVQGNLAILPQALAADFLRFCQLNPKPCPLIGTSAPGDPRVPEMGEDLDIRYRPVTLSRLEEWRAGGRARGHARISGATIW